MIKQDYENLLGLLHRVETKGVAEAQALITLAQKLAHKVENFGSEVKTEVEQKL